MTSGEQLCIQTESVTCLKAVSVSKVHRLLLSTLVGNFKCWLPNVAKLVAPRNGDERANGRRISRAQRMPTDQDDNHAKYLSQKARVSASAPPPKNRA